MTVGYLGWLIAFGAVCYVYGMTDVLAKIFPIAFLLTLGLAMNTCLMGELVQGRFGTGGYQFFMALWGMLLFSGGIILLFINHRLAPLLEGNKQFMDELSATGVKMRSGDSMPGFLMLVGVILLVWVVILIFSDTLARERRGEPKA